MRLNHNIVHPAVGVANIIIDYELFKRRKIYNIKLQKLLAFVAMEWQKKYGYFPYKEAFENWTLGAAQPYVYKLYKESSHKHPIKRPKPTYNKLGQAHIVRIKLKPDEYKLIHKICDKYAYSTGFKLVDEWNHQYHINDFKVPIKVS